MGDYHTVYKEKEGTTTEWDDLQVNLILVFSERRLPSVTANCSHECMH